MLIVADDLTGAADCAAVCTRLGLSSFVAMGNDALDMRADVVSVDADTRSMTASDAARRVQAVLEAAPPQSGRLLFKKIDSTLRGHVGPEIAAILHSYRAATASRATVVLAPAFPAAGRTTKGGRIYVAGFALEQTETWRREGHGADASLVRMVGEAGLSQALVDLQAVRGGTLPAIMKRMSSVADVMICDAETDDDLARIAAASLAVARPMIWSGSAGLAGQLMQAAGRTPAPHLAVPDSDRTGPLLFIVGSMSSVSQVQAAALTEETGVELLSIPVSRLIQGMSALAQDGWPDRMAQALDADRDILVMPEADLPEDLGHAQMLRETLASLAAPAASRIGGLFVTGGETARAVLTSLGVDGLHLHGELEPGIPIATASGAHRFAVVTKAGAFGDRQTMLHAHRALSDRSGRGPSFSRNA